MASGLLSVQRSRSEAGIELGIDLIPRSRLLHLDVGMRDHQSTAAD